MPWGVAAAAIGAGASIYAGNKAAKSAEKAADRTQQAGDEALAVQQGAYQQARTDLAPFAQQEGQAAGQLSAQMGLTPQAPGAGFQAESQFMGGGAPSGMDRFLEEMLAEQIAVSGRSGIGGNKDPGPAVAEGVKRTRSFLEDLKTQGKLPADYQIPSQSELSNIGGQVLSSYGDLKGLRRSDVGGGKQHSDYGMGDVETLLGRHFPQGVQPGGPGGQPGGPQMIGPDGQPMPGAGGPQAMGAEQIMGLAGVEALPPEIREQYIAQLMEDPRQDPELAAYLGLTPESLDVSSSYQQNPAYQRMVEAGTDVVNTGAAGSGSLYSGSRGRELRDVGQQVEQSYYMDAADRNAQMMADRRRERTAGMGRTAGAYGADESRKQSYYNNYMQILNSMAQPSTTTNVAQMGTSLGKDTSANLIGTARDVGDLKIGGANAQGAALADVGGGLMDLASSYI